MALWTASVYVPAREGGWLCVIERVEYDTDLCARYRLVSSEDEMAETGWAALPERLG